MNILTEYRHSKQILGRRWPFLFFAEKGSDYPYLAHLLQLALHTGEEVAYISADDNDALFRQKPAKLQLFYCNRLLGHVLNHLRADRVIMTMPDLEQFLFKRSAAVKEYIYVFHALVSTHQQYRTGAFDHYDTILCAGPHHEKEIRLREAQQQLRAKKLIPYGYPLLDNWQFSKPANPTILVAPTWYAQGILETCLDELIVELKKMPGQKVLRFHPEFKKRNKKRYAAIVKQVSAIADFQIDQEPDVRKSLSSASLLITDRSGIAFEFALASGRPVVFIDTPPKKFNDEAQTLGVVPIEDMYRAQVGECIVPSALGALSVVMEKLLQRGTVDYSSLKKELVYPTLEKIF